MLELVAEYIDKLDTAAEDRLLTTKLVPYQLSAENGTAGCLTGVATGAFKDRAAVDKRWWTPAMGLGIDVILQFNNACASNPVKTTEFIRNRILENRFAKLPKKELVCQSVSQ